MEKIYVTMTDRAMSGWGMAAGKINKLVIECDSWKEAEIVEANARRRSEMKHVNICTTKPNYPSSRYLTSWHNKSDYARWFVPNAFGG